MAGQDNRLGAPTEGLGQNVTFAIGDSQRTPQTGAGQQGSMRMAMGGDGRANNTASGQRVPIIQDNGVMQTLMRFGEGIIKPKLDAARNEAFVTGMQRVATGEAIKEIVDEQPWYANVFGDTPTVEGARAYAGFAKSQEVVSEIETAMPELRQKSPDEFKSIIADKLTNVNTGDLDTDVVVKQSLIKESASLMKRHTKEHIGWQQDNFAKAQQGAQTAAANRLAATLGRVSKGSVDDLASDVPMGSTIDAGDEMEAKQAFIQTFMPLPGVPIETTHKLHSATISSLLSQGNLHAYYTLEDAGIISDDWIGPENAKRLRDQADRVEARKRAEMPESLVGELARVRTMISLFDRTGINKEQADSIAKLNSNFKSLTGAREPLISGNDQATMQSNLLRKQIDEERSAKEAWARREQARSDAAHDARVKDSDTETAVVSTINAYVSGAHTGAFPAPLRREAWSVLNHKLPPESKHVLYAARRNQAINGNIDDEGKANILNTARLAESSDNSDAWDKLYRTEYLPLLEQDGNQRIALEYFDKEFGRKMAAYHSLSIAPGDTSAKVAGFVQATKLSGAAGNWSKTSDETAILSEVSKVARNDNPTGGIFTSDKLNDTALRMLTLRIKRPIEDFGNVPLSHSVPAQIIGLRAKGVEFVGGYMLETHNKGKPISVALNELGTGADRVPRERLNDVVRDTVAAHAKAQGIADPIPVYSLDANGQPALVVSGYDSASKWRSFPVRLEDFKKHYDDSKKLSKFSAFNLGAGPTAAEQQRAKALQGAKR